MTLNNYKNIIFAFGLDKYECNIFTDASPFNTNKYGMVQDIALIIRDPSITSAHNPDIIDFKRYLTGTLDDGYLKLWIFHSTDCVHQIQT